MVKCTAADLTPEGTGTRHEYNYKMAGMHFKGTGVFSRVVPWRGDCLGGLWRHREHLRLDFRG